jgi:hypothetical protein
MTFHTRKLLVLTAWTVTVLLVAFGTGIASTEAWAAVIAMALVPSAVAMRLWEAPPQTLAHENRAAQR